MKLYELFDVVDENTNLYITWNGELIATYDGRNSIDERLSVWDVIGIEPLNDHSLEIEILG